MQRLLVGRLGEFHLALEAGSRSESRAVSEADISPRPKRDHNKSI